MKNYTVNTQLNYLAESVQSSLYRNGKVFTRRDLDGNDDIYYGAVWKQQDVIINDARQLDQSRRRQLETDGFELVSTSLQQPDLHFLNNQYVVQEYYPECAELVRQTTNAAKVFAFDHNIRWPTESNSKKHIEGGQQVQAPLHFVHGDYTLWSAPQRLRDLTNPPGANDTLRSVLQGRESLLSTEDVSRSLNEGRFSIINVWRNIDNSPVMSEPLTMCNGQSVLPEELVTFEIHYRDRTGENYFAKYSANHEWWYYPHMSRDEALLLKQWDSAGGLARSGGLQADDNAACTFSFHTAFNDPNTPKDSPQRKSIEVRCIALFDY